MVRKLAIGLAALLGLILLLLLGYTAFHPRAMLNMARTAPAGITDVDAFLPAQKVDGCSGPALQTAPSSTLAKAAFAEMKRYSDEMGGVGLLVLVDGKVAGEAYGPAADAATRTQSMSMHKSMVAMLMGAAIADGLVKSLDDPIGNYLAEWKDDPRGQITIRQLLTQTSGLHNPSMAKMEGAAVEIMLGNVSENTLSLPIERKPGTFNYSNASFQLAGTVISRALAAAGRGDYAHYLSSRIWCPLGNRQALLWLEHEGGEPRYFAYLNATVRDWGRVGELLRLGGEWNGQQLLPSGWVEAITAPSPANPNYGMGIWRGTPWVKQRRYSKEVSLTVPQKEPFLADDVFYFDGFGGQRVYVVPSAKLVIARVGNPSFDWDESVLVNTALKGLAR